MTIHIVYASTSGHTEFVTGVLQKNWQEAGHTVTLTKAEKATPNDLLEGDVLLLASGTWNTGGQEGQLNPHMHELLFERLGPIDLQKKSIALVSLGDDRYYFTTRCTEHFMKWINQANGKALSPPLIIVNEPYDQEQKIIRWANTLLPL